MKVIASSLRKGNVVDIDGRLYVVLTAQNFHPGKGTPVTQVDMRRISDGTKVSERWKTTEQVERATVDEREYDFLYEDGEGYHFMEPVSYDQVVVSPDVVGDGKVFLTEGMRVYLQTHNDVAISIEFPQKVTVEITETEPVVKGQTASSSLQARHVHQRAARDGAAAYLGRHAHRHQHRRPELRRAREGLILAPLRSAVAKMQKGRPAGRPFLIPGEG